jgi:hypothetical protein
VQKCQYWGVFGTFILLLTLAKGHTYLPILRFIYYNTPYVSKPSPSAGGKG